MEIIKLNPRLQTAVRFVREGAVFADIGTDHAYLPIYLVEIGKVAHAVAADINRGPLAKAEENIEAYGMGSSIDTVLCDGLSKIAPDSVDDIAIFGMGGELIVKIIDEARWVRNPGIRLILQPMTHPEKLRAYLLENGFGIIGEELSSDRGKTYQTICAEFDGVAREADLFELSFGRFNLECPSPLLMELIASAARKLKRRISGMADGGESADEEKKLLNQINEYMERNKL